MDIRATEKGESEGRRNKGRTRSHGTYRHTWMQAQIGRKEVRVRKQPDDLSHACKGLGQVNEYRLPNDAASLVDVCFR